MRNKIVAASQDLALRIQESESKIQKKFVLERIPNDLLFMLCSVTLRENLIRSRLSGFQEWR
jgi:hypothetical protein